MSRRDPRAGKDAGMALDRLGSSFLSGGALRLRSLFSKDLKEEVLRRAKIKQRPTGSIVKNTMKAFALHTKSELKDLPSGVGRRYNNFGSVADASMVNSYKNVGRNDPCPCGSGKKFKKCCLNSQSLDNPSSGLHQVDSPALEI